MKRFFTALLLALMMTSCSIVKDLHKETHTVNDTVHTTFIDTIHVVKNVTVYDTTRTEVETHITNHIEEYYNPETGMLEKRVVDQVADIKYLQEQLSMMQSLIDSMKVSVNDSVHINNRTDTINEQHTTSGDATKSRFERIAESLLLISISIVLIALVIWGGKKKMHL